MMRVTAQVENVAGEHHVRVSTNGQEHALAIAPKATGRGSSVNGGELLFLALATCYCNDVYREAAQRNIRVASVSVDVEGEFGGPGDPGRNIRYRVRIAADASESEVCALAAHTDRVAEIHNTLRRGAAVTLSEVTAVSARSGF